MLVCVFACLCHNICGNIFVICKFIVLGPHWTEFDESLSCFEASIFSILTSLFLRWEEQLTVVNRTSVNPGSIRWESTHTVPVWHKVRKRESNCEKGAIHGWLSWQYTYNYWCWQLMLQACSMWETCLWLKGYIHTNTGTGLIQSTQN